MVVAFMLGMFLVLNVGFLEKLSSFYLVKNKDFQEIKIISNYIFMIFIFLGISFFYYDSIDFSFLSDKLFYITLFLENAILYVSLANYNKQKNFTQVSFAAFSTLYIIILLGYIYPIIFDLNTVLSSPYKNILEAVIYSLVFLSLTIFYFYDKLKAKEIHHPISLFIYAIVLANTLYFSISLIQKHQSFFVYSIIFFSFILQQLYWYHKKYNIVTLKKIFYIVSLRISKHM